VSCHRRTVGMSPPPKPTTEELQAAATRVLDSFTADDDGNSMRESLHSLSLGSAPNVDNDDDDDDDDDREDAPAAADGSPPTEPPSEVEADVAAGTAVEADDVGMTNGNGVEWEDPPTAAPAAEPERRPSEAPSGSDFEYEAPTPPPTLLQPQPSSERTQIVLLRLAGCTTPAEIRAWMQRATDGELTAMVKELRELQTSCHQTDAKLINLEVEMALLKQGQLAAEVRDAHDRRNSFEETSLARNALEVAQAGLRESEERREVMAVALAQKEKELGEMTVALQKAILSQKGVAEISKSWIKK